MIENVALVTIAFCSAPALSIVLRRRDSMLAVSIMAVFQWRRSGFSSSATRGLLAAAQEMPS
jgi:hypothetical protein